MIERILSWLKHTALTVMLVLSLAAVAQTGDKPFSNEQLDQLPAMHSSCWQPRGSAARV